ncbi:Predicted arabinose efflux permease, MFS family [Luteibacter sp. UNCMF331Sha3.1]|nr:MFS transporter [Luteibacter sp. UNCMF331Sha3.1]SEM80355.1 Predicted arabinose efflux permease, MFS family [Luteibacter sp. UNCMF331Sha3.1]
MPSHSVTTPAAWAGVLAMSLGAFALVASEFMPVSLLTPIAADLHITEGRAGQAIAISGAFALVTSLSIATLARRLDRKRLLLALTSLMIVSGGIVGFAPDGSLFMLGRALIGIAIGGFWSMSAAAAMRLVPADAVPRAMAVINGGNALATVAAAPVGSFLGATVGWRWALFCVVPIAFVALIWQSISLPAMAASGRAQHTNVLKLFRRPQVAWGMFAVGLFFMGQFAMFTYLRPFLEKVTRVDVATLSYLLLTVGAAGCVGTVVIGRFLDRRLHHTLIVIPLLMAVVVAALLAGGAHVGITALLLAAWGLLGTSAPVGWWTWLSRTLPDDAEAGGGLMVAVVQLAITLGATVGGVLFDTLGHRATFAASAGLLVISAVVAAGAARMHAWRAPVPVG